MRSAIKGTMRSVGACLAALNPERGKEDFVGVPGAPGPALPYEAIRCRPGGVVVQGLWAADRMLGVQATWVSTPEADWLTVRLAWPLALGDKLARGCVGFQGRVQSCPWQTGSQVGL